MFRENSWLQNRLPEYLWIALIINKCGREKGLDRCLYLVDELSKINSGLVVPSFSQITKMSTEDQEKFFKCVLKATDKSTLAPLTALFTQCEYPLFVNSFFVEGLSFEDRFTILMSAMKEASDHQSYFSTDIRYIVLCYQIFSGKLKVLKETIDELKLYPNISHEDERMRYIRPSIRASEIGIPLDILGIDNSDYLKKFWGGVVSKMSECNLFSVQYPVEEENKDVYMQKLKTIMIYFRDLLTTNPLDQKLTVILGIVTYIIISLRGKHMSLQRQPIWTTKIGNIYHF